MSHRRAVFLPLACSLLLIPLASVHESSAQLLRPNAPVGQFETVGNSLVSGQQIFLGTLDKIYVVDKTENNPVNINGHPAWAAEWSTSGGTGRPMDAVTNTFCAGGNVLGNGTWLNVGGNQAVTYGGLTASSQNGGGPYDDLDGGKSLLDPCDDGTCEWEFAKTMTTRRWYPSVETLEDGRAIIIGGCNWGGFVNDPAQDNPTYEFFPPTADPSPIASPFLSRTLPVNLYAITFLLPSGKLFMQANFDTVLLDYHTNTEYALSKMPHACRTYPASSGTAMLPLTPANNWTATLVFCGGSDITTNQWNTKWDIATYPASTSCVRITPDVSPNYEEDDSLDVGRSMGNMILLPTGKIVYLNGAGLGVAGYGNDSWAIDQSYADNAILQPMLYDPAAPAGSRWSTGGFSKSAIARMYHSTATLTPDGSIVVMGSNPNADFNDKAKFPTEYRVERLYPSYYNSPRPQPQGIPSTLSYGGAPFNITLTAADLSNNVQNIQNATAVIIRTGFSTHALNMGQRMLVLESTYTGNPDGSGVLHVSQLPPNPAILAPGPALFFVVVNGVPSVASQVMVGSGKIEQQQALAVQPLPQSAILSNNDTTKSPDGSNSPGRNQQASSAVSSMLASRSNVWWDFVAVAFLTGAALLPSFT
ncbi:copper radical oxidase [Trametopsis cervina]|nr:copper radical oxidase [Trametopsis cervina]